MTHSFVKLSKKAYIVFIGFSLSKSFDTEAITHGSMWKRLNMKMNLIGQFIIPNITHQFLVSATTTNLQSKRKEMCNMFNVKTTT